MSLQGVKEPESSGDAEEKCGVDMPRQDEGRYCGCVRPAGHDGDHVFGPLAWPQGTNDPGLIRGIKR